MNKLSEWERAMRWSQVINFIIQQSFVQKKKSNRNRCIHSIHAQSYYIHLECPYSYFANNPKKHKKKFIYRYMRESGRKTSMGAFLLNCLVGALRWWSDVKRWNGYILSCYLFLSAIFFPFHSFSFESRLPSIHKCFTQSWNVTKSAAEMDAR